MQELLLAMQAWPTIVQGALGSALFALIVTLGQYLNKYIIAKYSHHSKISRATWLRNRIIQSRAKLSTSYSEDGAYAALLIYRASRPLFKSLIWLSLGLMSQVLSMPISAVGFAGSIYYLFQGYNIVAPLKDNDVKKLQAQLKEAEIELGKIEAS
jgi:hypothetical protein